MTPAAGAPIGFDCPPICLIGASGDIKGSVGISGLDFNPVADRLCVVSNSEQKLRIDGDTGSTMTDANLNPGSPSIAAAAYTTASPWLVAHACW